MHETFRQEYVRCGKRGCKSCPHGPYWYAYWREGGKLRKRYIGKTLPTHSIPDGLGTNRLDDIFSPDRRSKSLACEILGIPIDASYVDARAAFRRAQLQAHPDRGGEEGSSKRANVAWDYLSRLLTLG